MDVGVPPDPMSFSGALGRGTYQSIVAGTVRRPTPQYYVSAGELLRLHDAHADVQKSMLIRDAVFDPLFPEAAPVAGTYRLSPEQRKARHLYEVMPAIRKRSIVLSRLRQQRRANDKAGAPKPRMTADAAAYFAPQQHVGTNCQPNFWQHKASRHVLPNPQWRRRADLGGVTRVEGNLALYSKDY